MQPAFIRNNSNARVFWATLLAAVVALGIAYFIATDKLMIAAALTLLCLFGAALFVAAPLRFEIVLSWSIIPLVLLYPMSINNNSSLPSLSTVRILGLLVLLALLFGKNVVKQKPPSLVVLIFTIANAALFFITLISVLDARHFNSVAYSVWLNQSSMILLIGGLSVFLPNPRQLIHQFSLAAFPLSWLLFAISLIEYFSNKSLYGFEIRSFGFDRRVPGPFGTAEVLGFMFSVLIALVFFARRTNAAIPGWFSFLTVGVSVMGASLTFFRSSWLSVIAVLLVAAIMYPPKLNLVAVWLKIIASLSGIVFAGIFLSAVLWGQSKKISGSMDDDFSVLGAMTERIFSDNSQNSAGNRASFASVAKLMIAHNPWSGIGYGEFSKQIFKYIPPDLSAAQFSAVYVQANEGLVAHNSYIQMAAECGLPAMALLIFLNLFPSVAIAFRVRAPMERHYLSLALSIGVALVVSCSSQSMFYYGALALVWASLLFGALLRATDPQRTVTQQ